MRITFPRVPDHEPAYAVVQRDDGVVYRLYGGIGGRGLPHDIRHLVVEKTLGISDGIWGDIASGMVLRSMRYVSGRRRPHEERRSRELIRAFRVRGLRAEMLANLVEQVAALDDPSPSEVRLLATRVLSVLPPEEVTLLLEDGDEIVAAARALRVEAARWARLRVGESLSYDWPAPHRGHGRRQAG
jgi:hypothetical protein